MDRPYSIGPFWLTLGAQNHSKLVKLHKQFGNASPTNLRNLLKIAGFFSTEISELINEVCDNSIVCKTHKKPPPRPVAGLPRATTFYYTVAIDIRSFEKNI